MAWEPASIEAVNKIVAADLRQCDPKQIALFEKYKVEPYCARIVRYGNNETVVVVARKGKEVIYWEDVEEGFERSAISEDGLIQEHGTNQNNLGLMLNCWIE
ncbi:MAG TPA: hypothetical protein VJO35_12035 [Terriglobales bacterium]|nr:hypothetical protein [Terriglobales bacterium]